MDEEDMALQQVEIAKYLEAIEKFLKEDLAQVNISPEEYKED